jgi:hypothetical protein
MTFWVLGGPFGVHCQCLDKCTSEYLNSTPESILCTYCHSGCSLRCFFFHVECALGAWIAFLILSASLPFWVHSEDFNTILSVQSASIPFRVHSVCANDILGVFSVHSECFSPQVNTCECILTRLYHSEALVSARHQPWGSILKHT